MMRFGCYPIREDAVMVESSRHTALD